MKRGLVQLAALALFALSAAFTAGQTSTTPANPSQPYTQSGILKNLNSTQAEIQVVDAPGKAPRMMMFVINENTKRNQVTIGQVVLVTYIKYPGKRVAIKLDAAYPTVRSHTVYPYGVFSTAGPARNGNTQAGTPMRSVTQASPQAQPRANAVGPASPQAGPK
jgi:hypothetical protein